MINISNIEVFNFDGAFRGLRNPLDSWAKSDSYNCSQDYCGGCSHANTEACYQPDGFIIGPKDMELAQRMIAGGPDESKFMRQIFVSMDIDAPLYWWKECSTYQIATVTNSCSTMHKITSKPITRESFGFDLDLYGEPCFETNGEIYTFGDDFDSIIETCERLRLKYLETKDKKYWRALIQILPCGWMQKRTWTGNYMNLRNMYFARKNHKLSEWREFCQTIEQLPYAKDLICYKKEIKGEENGKN